MFLKNSGFVCLNRCRCASQAFTALIIFEIGKKITRIINSACRQSEDTRFDEHLGDVRTSSLACGRDLVCFLPRFSRNVSRNKEYLLLIYEGVQHNFLFPFYTIPLREDENLPEVSSGYIHGSRPYGLPQSSFNLSGS